jgi:5-methylcytosine-specific restriction enzyme subunit McrC
MKSLVLGEHNRIYRWNRTSEPPAESEGRLFLSARLYHRLHQYDRSRAKDGNDIFEWHDDHARLRQWVGVVQIPGLSVEILPKVDFRLDANDYGSSVIEQVEARSNLLYMLSMAGDIPTRERDVAELASRKSPLLESLAAIFAKRLLSELLCGPVRDYVRYEENLRILKGKLDVSRHITKNCGHRERFLCRYDEFTLDTPLNRLFLFACKVLLASTHAPKTQEDLKYCLLALEGVTDVAVGRSLLDSIVLTRQNERFADLYHFCRLLLLDQAPLIQAGSSQCFSLLFDMNLLFEGFVAGFIQRHVIPKLGGVELFRQARGQRRFLLNSAKGGILPLRPDILIRRNNRLLIIDTKWKRLSDHQGRNRFSLSNSDLYQLYAYTHRYASDGSFLLYPAIPGFKKQDYAILDASGTATERSIGVRFICINRNLHNAVQRGELAAELMELIIDGLGLSGSTNNAILPAKGVA